MFVGNDITMDELAIAYGTFDKDTYYHEVDLTTRLKFRTAIDDIRPFVTRTSKIIDIGTGNGLFPTLLREQDYQAVYAHDFPSPELDLLREKGITIYQDFDYESLPSAAFDMVTLMDIAEHVLEPRFLFESCFRILKPGGRVYLHTPAVSRIDRILHKFASIPGLRSLTRFWQRGRTSIFHLQNYTDKSLKKLLTDAGFGDVRLRRENELSWPVSRYVQVYVCDRYHVNKAVVPILTPFFYPLFKSKFFNANKAIALATKPVS